VCSSDLTTPNPEYNEDLAMFQTLGLIPTKPFAKGDKPELKPDPGQSFEQRVKERNTGAEV
jgi:biotin synthase